MLSSSLIFFGREFQSLGAASIKERSPQCLDLQRGVAKNNSCIVFNFKVAYPTTYQCTGLWRSFSGGKHLFLFYINVLQSKEYIIAQNVVYYLHKKSIGSNCLISSLLTEADLGGRRGGRTDPTRKVSSLQRDVPPFRQSWIRPWLRQRVLEEPLCLKVK